MVSTGLYRITKNGIPLDLKRPVLNRAAAMIFFENLRARSVISHQPYAWSGVKDTVYAEFFGDKYVLEPIEQVKRSA